MDRYIPDEHLDRLMMRFIAERHVEIVSTARPAAEVARMGQTHLAGSVRRPTATPMPRLTRPLAVALWLAVLLAAFAGAAIVGSRLVVPHPDPLAGWVTEEVEPGVVRVVNDGYRDLTPVGRDPGRELAIGDDGSAWMWTEGTLQRLGVPDSESPIDGPQGVGGYIGDLLIDPDGRPLVGGLDGVHRLDGNVWTQLRSGPSRLDISPDGTLWSASPTSFGSSAGVSRMTPSGWEDHAIDLDLASALRVDSSVRLLGLQIKGFSAAPDGSVWVGIAVQVSNPNEFGHLLLRFDGETWSVLDALDVGSYHDMATFDVGPDGTAWVYLDQGHLLDPHLARLSDGTWTVYSSDDEVKPIGIMGEAEGFMEVDQAGTLWVGGEWPSAVSCGGLRSFDGSEWHRYLQGICVMDLDIAPDGSVWVVGEREAWPTSGRATGNTYRIDPTHTEAGEGSS